MLTFKKEKRKEKRNTTLQDVLFWKDHFSVDNILHHHIIDYIPITAHPVMFYCLFIDMRYVITGQMGIAEI